LRLNIFGIVWPIVKELPVEPSMRLKQSDILRGVTRITGHLRDQLIAPRREIAIFLLLQGGVPECVQVPHYMNRR
jgi:hypothetical protein